MTRALVIAVALTVTPTADGQGAKRAGAVQGIDVRIETVRITPEMKLFPADRNSPTVKAPDGMTLCIVTLTVAPSATATLLSAADFMLSDTSGAKFRLAFTKLFNMCEGRRKQTCELPFNVAKNVKVTTLIVGTLELSLEGLAR